jgi:glutaryl-CoA dehydrogenase (non-decarboxylating)
VGITEACLEASLAYAQERVQFNVALIEHQLIRRMISDMFIGLRASRLLCAVAGASGNTQDGSWIENTFIAKYFASETAMKAATDTVQIHGANGCSSQYPAARLFRDAKVMEIIEGSSQIQQTTIADFALVSGRM